MPGLKSLVWLLPLAGLWKLFPGISPLLCMVLIAVTLFLLIKVHLLLIYAGEHKMPRLWEVAAWIFGWVGLNPGRFFRRGDGGKTRLQEAGFAVLKMALGVLCLVWATRLEQGFVSGWVTLTGLGLCLHFGFLHLLAVGWNLAGRNVRPIMKAPVFARSVSDFWGRRWNLAFRDYAHVTLFAPLSRRYGAVPATMAGFVFSGLVHEVAISVPAHGGYGLPTIYFLLQALALLTERQCSFLKNSVAGWLWTVAWVAVPAPLMFHRPFLEQVVHPLLGFIQPVFGGS